MPLTISQKTGVKYASSGSTWSKSSKYLDEKENVSFKQEVLILFMSAYEQAMIRTMFWKRTGDDTFTQNGIKYIISNNANNDTYACRGTVCNLWNHMSPDIVGELDMDNYTTWRKELVNILKDWEKKYHKHAKQVNPEMNAIHMGCMRPLCNLMDSNFNFYNFKQLMKKNK